jgi:uncharacterized protein YkwD
MLFSFLRRAFWPARAVVSFSTNSNSHTRSSACSSVSNNLESLETRTLFAVATPTNEEQFMLELINRARLSPAAEAARFRIALNEGLANGTLPSDRRQPLAFNPNLISAARTHSQWMITAKTFSHTGNGGSNPGARMSSAGYAFASGLSGWAENLGWAGRRLETPKTADMVNEIHGRLFVDRDIAGRGHRVNMLNGKMKEVGVGIATGTVNGFKAAMVSTDFAYSSGNSFLTGVAFKDTVKGNKFYDIGEGMGGIAITAKRASDGKTFTTNTWSSGGYSLALAPGTYTISASGGLASATKSVTINSSNIKLDFLPTEQLDKQAPTAKFSSKLITKAGKNRTIQITYKDATLIDATTINTGDILISGKAFKKSCKLISVTPDGDSSSITATYRVSGPRGGWTKARYTVSLKANAIKDTFGNFTKAKKLGSFIGK